MPMYKGQNIEGMKKGFSLVEQQMSDQAEFRPRYIMRERCGSCKEYARDNSFLWMYPCAECGHMHKLGGEQIVGHWEMTYEEVEKEVPYWFFWTTNKMVKVEKKIWVAPWELPIYPGE
jgi:hypothetical protein